MFALRRKLREAAFSVLPIVVLVLLLHGTVAPLDGLVLARFLAGACFIIAGLAVFLFGVDLSIDRIGRYLGTSIAKTNKLWIVVAAGAVLGFVISVAEPDLQILADQVETVSNGALSQSLIVGTVSLGIALLLAAGLVRIVYNVPLNCMLTVLYALIGVLALFTSPAFLSISFDASGATTGALTVPFILALSVGISALKKDSKASEKDSFGLVAVASTGAILSMMALDILSPPKQIAGAVNVAQQEAQGLFTPFLHILPHAAAEVLAALVPILVIFLVYARFSGRVPRHESGKILIGLFYSLVGLVLLLTGVNAGFLRVGTLVGYQIAALQNPALLIGAGFFLGLATILAEPAVYILTNQIENVTSGSVRRITVLIALAAGVAVSVALSMVRILVPGLRLWHILLPGYALAVGLTYVVPKLFVGIAFDSGGVASGPMTAVFILAFAQGAAQSMEGADVLLDGFGVIAMVALTPLITLQVLGLLYRRKTRKGGLRREG